MTVPSAFTAVTGRDHWEVLLRARAIENQLFVVAAGQVGPAAPHYESWGHSMVVDPWGRVLAEVAEGEGHAIADARRRRAGGRPRAGALAGEPPRGRIPLAR